MPAQALKCALVSAGIENFDLKDLHGSCENGLYVFDVCTCYLRYEFFVDRESFEVLGINTEPIVSLKVRKPEEDEPMPEAA